MVALPQPTNADLAKTVEPEPAELELAQPYSSYEVDLVAKTVWGEARGCSREEQMLVVWCICNRADAGNKSIEEVVTAPRQFHGYHDDNPVEPAIASVVEEVLEAWARGEEALVLPPYATTSEYLFFRGDGRHNWFREVY